MQIDHCVCTNLSFAQLRDLARRQGLTFDQLADCTGASRGCGMCRPYLRRALHTGQTVFHQILPDDADADRGPAA